MTEPENHAANPAADPAADTDDLLSVHLSRVLPAAPERIYAAWTTGEMKDWWGPDGFEGVAAEADPRPGGAFFVEMRDPDGTVHRMAGVYTELDPPSLVCMEIRHRQFEGAADRPEGYLPTQLRIELKPHPDGTELVLTHTGFLDAAMPVRFNAGWTGSLDRLERILRA